MVQHVRIEKELYYQYLQTVIGHVDTALVCFDDNGRIALINEAAGKLLNTQILQTLEYLKRKQPEIIHLLENIRTGEQKLLKIRIRSELMQLSVRATEFKLQGTLYKLVALQDIKNELESRELESWQKLIRVLTHEIMNSVTPITSLSQAIKDSLEDENGRSVNLKDIGTEDLDDIHRSILTIENRSKGLLRFVETYKNLTKLPKPEFEKIRISDLLNHISSLMQAELDKEGIKLQIQNDEKEAVIYADHDMMVRVLINLITNARDALPGRKDAVILIQSQRDQQNRVNILIKDNGKGMDATTLENIFIPFFTTKEKGSGIGLSLCRQIMHLHKGSITAESQEHLGTSILLKL
ncbi:MAG: ATP-binding protein [Bacteroidota bacterium]|nr:ATP-binding protein [Bacteroidota bacterium]